MPRFSKLRTLKLCLSVAAILAAALAAFSPALAQSVDKRKAQAKPAAYQRETDPSRYVGTETCKTCHADIPSKGFAKSFEDSPHFVTTLDTKKGSVPQAPTPGTLCRV